MVLCVKKSFTKKFYKTNTRFEFLDPDYPSLEPVGSDPDPLGSGYGSGSENFEFIGSGSGSGFDNFKSGSVPGL